MQKNTEESLKKHQIVLLGIGHTNAHGLAQWKMNPIPDASLTCISNFPTATYSGMLPAVLAGQKTVAEMEIDLIQLCEAADATLLIDDVNSLNPSKQQIQLAQHPPLDFDVLSIGIGSVPDMQGINATFGNVVPIKPMQTFLSRLGDSIKLRQHEKEHLLNVIVVGGGAAGVEISCCLPGFLRTQTAGEEYQITLVHRGNEILSGSSAGVRRRTKDALQRQHANVISNRTVVSVTSDHVVLDQGESLPADVVIWATGATAPAQLANFDLPMNKNGFLLTDQTLRTLSGAPIFVVGDSGTIQGAETPKAGVFAVRQGPILWENIQRELTERPQQVYQPQRSFLRLINTGDGSAIAEWFGMSAQGQWVRSIKDDIDSRFVSKYQVPIASPDNSSPMQCRGCGSKLSSEDLTESLSALAIEHDDAAIVEVAGTPIAISTDFFSAPFRDPFLNGRIAAIHAANDLCAMGATLTAAVANVVVPLGPALKQQRFVAEILAGAQKELSAMSPDIKIVGGHTCVGPRAEIGFTVIGKSHATSFQKSNARTGDVLFLTKPLGTGILMAAHRQAQCKARWYQELLRSMLLHSTEVALVAQKIGVTAATDISGFGLIGHLQEILTASETSAELEINNIPILEGAQELSARGFRSSLFEKNFTTSQYVDMGDESRLSAIQPVLFDPQTCGGLLLCVQPALIEAFQTSCDRAGIALHRIGALRAKDDQTKLVSLIG